MNIYLSKLFAFSLALSLLGCSLYQSEGRKFLEDQAFTFSGDPISFTVVEKNGACIETTDIDKTFFNTDSWSLVAESFEPNYSVFQSNSSETYSMVVVRTPNYQTHLFACEYIYSDKSDIEAHQKHDLEDALLTIKSMLN